MDTVQQSEYRFNTFETLNTAILQQDVDDLNGSMWIALESRSGVMHEIERIFRRLASALHAGCIVSGK